MKKMQEIYINLDDSGKLSNHEHISVYGGLVFLSKSEKDKFVTQYRSIVNDIKCKYCQSKCNKLCPEIKNTNIKNSDKRRIMNYIKKYYVTALVIKNDLVYEHIKTNKGAKGRFLDYSLRRMIKEIVKNLISSGKVDPDAPIRIIINIDEQTTKNNGYYNLHDGILEELKYGISNFDYFMSVAPIVKSDLEIRLTYQNSAKSYVVQAADLLAGTIRHKSIIALNNNIEIQEELNSFVDLKMILP